MPLLDINTTVLRNSYSQNGTFSECLYSTEIPFWKGKREYLGGCGQGSVKN